ncbi:hypothetical protein MAR_024472 [Mya arenaria]|uniref:Uncharacterized protein n=1 Tax=Mya arenaria TaxID=6604 RepID=A0ABY7DU11_MYAAR|nr:hypothetical protein MAR_024472 [Mya arenaria]
MGGASSERRSHQGM